MIIDWLLTVVCARNLPRHLIRVVILNACYSQLQAQAITKVIDCAIGMNTAIGDKAAINFASAFYRAIGFDRSIQQAFEQGKVSLLLEGIPEDKTPEIFIRQGVDISRLFLLSSVTHSIYEPYNETYADTSNWPFVATDARLIVVKGKDEGKVFLLNRLRMVVGRASMCDIKLSDTCISRAIFAIIWNPDNRTHFVEDWGHPSRIIINGQLVERHTLVALKVGDEIRIGDTLLRYEQEGLHLKNRA